MKVINFDKNSFGDEVVTKSCIRVGWKRKGLKKRKISNHLEEERNGAVIRGGMWIKGRFFICFALKK